MTVKEAILQSLEDLGGLVSHKDVYNHIIKRKYFAFGGNTPEATVSAQLGDLIRKGDTRLKRLKQTGETYSYYLTKNEQNIGVDF